MILPAALRHLALIAEAGVASASRARSAACSTSWSTALGELEAANADPATSRAWSWRSTPATSSSRRWREVREAADKLEKVVADDLWPLPKYEEMLFIK